MLQEMVLLERVRCGRGRARGCDDGAVEAALLVVLVGLVGWVELLKWEGSSLVGVRTMVRKNSPF